MKWITLIFLFAPLFASPHWMTKQIAEDLSPFYQDGYCSESLLKFFEAEKDHYHLCLFKISSNTIQYEVHKNLDRDRFSIIRDALIELAQTFRLPDTTFLVSLHDKLDNFSPVPVFVMSKIVGDAKILFPDFEALYGRYQVVKDLNLETTDFPVPWKARKDLLIWRGSGAQGCINPKNMHRKSRVIICQLSEEYPDLIDAGFTHCIPTCVENYRKETIPFEEILSHRYQIWIDGNASSYSNSGWRLYTGSTVLKPESSYTQWYYSDMEPWVHYVPVQEHLKDLVDTLLFLKKHPDLAEQIAHNGRQFAREHINKEMNLLYLHDLLWAYASLSNL